MCRFRLCVVMPLILHHGRFGMPWRRRACTAQLTFAGSPVEKFPGDFQVQDLWGTVQR